LQISGLSKHFSNSIFDNHFLTAHRAIDHDLTFSNTEISHDGLVGKKVDAKINTSDCDEKVREVIIMVRRILMTNLEKAREEADVVLEETGNEDLENMVRFLENGFLGTIYTGRIVGKIRQKIPLKIGLKNLN